MKNNLNSTHTIQGHIKEMKKDLKGLLEVLQLYKHERNASESSEEDVLLAEELLTRHLKKMNQRGKEVDRFILGLKYPPLDCPN